jgi:OmpA-OmpF porin, OOP family
MRNAGLLLIALVLGCGGAQLDGRAGTIGELIVTARDNGAQRCAPIELAMAESHHDFALQDMDEGNYYRAREELAVAETNAQEAIRKSPKARCNPQEPPPRVAVAVKDSDGDGLADDVDECPMDPEDFDGFEDADGCPDPDNDHDGIADAIDECPMDPEDIDGFQDADGCPDDDNDGDGLADTIDECPDEAEDIDGFEDADGCPDPDNDGDGVADTVDKCPDEYAETADGCPQKYKMVVVTEKKIELKQTVYFDYDKATIKRRSFALLDEVAQALTDNPKIHVDVEGHTDGRGPDAYNLTLSQKCAEAVLDYLVGQGVDESRLNPVGYGEAKPIADNRTKAGRDQNRRVEFVITRR